MFTIRKISIMFYYDFPNEKQQIIDEFLEKFADTYPDFCYTISVKDLADDEVFFQTEDQIRSVIESWLDSPGSYGSLARELQEYLDGIPEIGEIRELEWGYVMAADNATFLFMSDSWSDSGLFLNT